MSSPPPASEVAAVAAHEVERVTVTADTLTWIGGTVEARGHVRVTIGPDTLDAQAASGTAESLRVTEGVWSRAGGELRFATATVNLRAGSGIVTDARLAREGVVLEAATLTVSEGGSSVHAESARLEPCACADGGRPAVSFRARSVELVGAEVAVIRGGSVRVFDVPVLPVPWWREPLDPAAFRLMLPQVSWGSNGWAASERVRFGAGPELVEVGPAWREDRGGRVDASLTGPVTASTALGWDSVWGAPRGAAVTRGGFADAERRLAWDVTVQSDPLYAEDYGTSWVDRGVDWHDRRALGQWGPVRGSVWLPDDGSLGRYAAVRYRPELARPGWSLAPSVEAGVAGAPYALVGGDSRASHSWTALHLEATAAAAAAAQWAGGVPALAGFVATSGRAEVPFWGEMAGVRGQFFVGGRVEAVLADPLGVPLHVRPGLDGTGFGAGPSARATASLGGAVLAGEAALLVGADGTPAPYVTVDTSAEAWSARVEAQTDRAMFQVQTRGTLAVDAGAFLSEPIRVGWLDVTWHPNRLLLGGGASRGFATDSPLTGAARVGYDDGCSSLVLSAAFSPDRALPDVGLNLALRK